MELGLSIGAIITAAAALALAAGRQRKALRREEAAALFHVPDPSRVVFTMNATHGLNLAIHSLVKPGRQVLISGFEHNAVTRPLHAAGAEIRVAGRTLFDPAELLNAWEEALPGCDAAVCTSVSNVFGYVLPIQEIAALCRSRGVPLIVDASQAAGVLPVDFESLQAAFIAMPGHKGLLGPQGTGLLLCDEVGEPLLQGGSGAESRLQTMPALLPERLEAGTLNVCGIAGLLEGLRYVRERGEASILAHEHGLLTRAISLLRESSLHLYTGTEQSGVLSLRSPRLDCEELAALLSARGVCVRAGLHCAPFAHESAGTLETGTLRMKKQGSGGGHNGLGDIETALGTQNYCRLRVGVGNHFGRGHQIDYVLGRFDSEELAALEPAIGQACEAVKCFATQGADRAMNMYNKKGKSE